MIEADTEVAGDATAACLVPFLAILAAAIFARAVSGNFEWFYSVRLLAALGALWMFRDTYASLKWKAGWAAPLTGALAFLIWIGLDRLTAAPHASAMPVRLAAATPALRTLWIVLRAWGAVVTVPIAEELAFRGFLLRRLVSADFESVSFRAVTWFALLLSSVIFGLLHGGLWIAGVAAGLLYALAAGQRGLLTDAMIAHATTNGLLAAYVLTFHQYHLW
jgi:CAAX prenyl protease-like protein